MSFKPLRVAHPLRDLITPVADSERAFDQPPIFSGRPFLNLIRFESNHPCSFAKEVLSRLTPGRNCILVSGMVFPYTNPLGGSYFSLRSSFTGAIKNWPRYKRCPSLPLPCSWSCSQTSLPHQEYRHRHQQAHRPKWWRCGLHCVEPYYFPMC